MSDESRRTPPLFTHIDVTTSTTTGAGTLVAGSSVNMLLAQIEIRTATHRHTATRPARRVLRRGSAADRPGRHRRGLRADAASSRCRRPGP